MVIYEIEAVVDKDLIEEFEQYMSDRHMPGLIRTGFFESAEFNETEPGTYVIKYMVRDRETLDNYLETKAEALRNDFAREFPIGIVLTRNIYEVGEGEKSLDASAEIA